MRELQALAQSNLQDYTSKLTTYVRQRAAQALRECNGGRIAAEELLHEWANEDNKLWRELREPHEPRRWRHPSILAAVYDAAIEAQKDQPAS